jgi:RNA polymerase sigma factor (sigma-70 family)
MSTTRYPGAQEYEQTESVTLGVSVGNYSGPGLDPVSLCARIRNGESEAETEFFVYFQRRVRAFLGGRTKDRQLADEVFQEIMMALLCALRESRVREPEMLTSYVYGVARNQLMEHLRRRAREKLDAFPEGMDFAAPQVDHEAQQRYQTVEREIAKLDRDDRAILSMTLVDGLKPGEIAETLRLTSEVVRQRKSRALKKLVARLGFGSQNNDSQRLIP